MKQSALTFTILIYLSLSLSLSTCLWNLSVCIFLDAPSLKVLWRGDARNKRTRSLERRDTSRRQIPLFTSPQLSRGFFLFQNTQKRERWKMCLSLRLDKTKKTEILNTATRTESSAKRVKGRQAATVRKKGRKDEERRDTVGKRDCEREKSSSPPSLSLFRSHQKKVSIAARLQSGRKEKRREREVAGKKKEERRIFLPSLLLTEKVHKMM